MHGRVAVAVRRTDGSGTLVRTGATTSTSGDPIRNQPYQGGGRAAGCAARPRRGARAAWRVRSGRGQAAGGDVPELGREGGAEAGGLDGPGGDAAEHDIPARGGVGLVGGPSFIYCHLGA